MLGHRSAECQQLRDNITRARGGLEYAIQIRTRGVFGIDLILRLLRVED
jgi:hypothetical protein